MPSNDRVARQVGAALRRVRERQKRQQHRVAAAAGISPGLLSAAEDFGLHLGPWGLP